MYLHKRWEQNVKNGISSTFKNNSSEQGSETWEHMRIIKVLTKTSQVRNQDDGHRILLGWISKKRGGEHVFDILNYPNISLQVLTGYIVVFFKKDNVQSILKIESNEIYQWMLRLEEIFWGEAGYQCDLIISSQGKMKHEQYVTKHCWIRQNLEQVIKNTSTNEGQTDITCLQIQQKTGDAALLE